LRIGINKQHALLKDPKGAGQVDCGGRLSDSAFLVCYGNDFSHEDEGSAIG
jgi:hypothetical protein